MFKIDKTDEYEKWLEGLRDQVAKSKVLARIRRLQLGNPGDHKGLGGGLSELRIPHGKGIRVYYAKYGERVYLLIGGGDKSTQSRDIEAARKLLAKAREEQ